MWYVLVVLVSIVALIAIGIFIGGRMVEYCIEYWVSRQADKPVDVALWKCSVAGIFIGWNIAIPATLVTWIFDLAD